MSLRFIALALLIMGTNGGLQSFAKPPELPVDPAVDCRERSAGRLPDHHSAAQRAQPAILSDLRSLFFTLDPNVLSVDEDDGGDVVAPMLLLQWTPEGIRVIEINPPAEDENLMQVKAVDTLVGFVMDLPLFGLDSSYTIGASGVRLLHQAARRAYSATASIPFAKKTGNAAPRPASVRTETGSNVSAAEECECTREEQALHHGDLDDNLRKLTRARSIYLHAERSRKEGLSSLACQLYFEVHKLCPGSRYDRLATVKLKQLGFEPPLDAAEEARAEDWKAPTKAIAVKRKKFEKNKDFKGKAARAD